MTGPVHGLDEVRIIGRRTPRNKRLILGPGLGTDTGHVTSGDGEMGIVDVAGETDNETKCTKVPSTFLARGNGFTGVTFRLRS